MIREAAPVNRNTAVVLFGGGTLLLSPWIDRVPALLMAYYPGQEGGTALAEILFGRINPSGKLPFVIPCREDDFPDMDWSAAKQHYEYYYGYTKLEKESIRPLMPFVFGLSYTRFALSHAAFSTDRTVIWASCRIKNAGSVTGT